MLLFHDITWSDTYVKDTASISQHLSQHCIYFTTIHIITSGLWLIREKSNDMFIWEK